MNHIELKSSLNTSKNIAPFLKISLLVDGCPLGADHFIDLFELANSCQSSGELWIFTCSCGQPECAGINDGIIVEHTESSVIWTYVDPIANARINLMDDEEYEAYQATKNSIRLEFEADEYERGLATGIRQIQSLMVLGGIRSISYHRDEWERSLLLETDIFTARGHKPYRRLIAKRIDIDAYNGGNCQANGIYFSIEELGLPNELLAQFSQWRLLESFAQSKEDLPAYEKYLSAGRAFCSELKHYIGNGAVVKFKYHPPKCYNPVAWEITEEIR